MLYGVSYLTVHYNEDINHKGKELKMNTMELTAKVFDTDEEVTVTPMAVFGLDDFSTIYITDADGRGLWLDCDLDWMIDLEEGDIYDAETIEGVFGGDKIRRA